MYVRTYVHCKLYCLIIVNNVHMYMYISIQGGDILYMHVHELVCGCVGT